MSAQGSVPSPAAGRTTLRVALIVVVVAIAAATVGYLIGRRTAASHDVMSASPADAHRVALVRAAPCASGTCQTLWLGNSWEDAAQVAALGPGERVEDIAWARDGYRMAFIINGYQLRVFDAESRKPVKQVNLIEPDGTPSSRIVRGVTFSQNGAAVTFDDCPRYQSGCKSGMAAIR